MKKLSFLLSLLITLIFVSCDPSESNGPTQNDDTFAENFGSEVSKDFIGQVVDADNNPIQNATIKIGASTVQTDVNGVFIVNGATVHEKFAYIKATKAGYIDGSRAMVPTSGKNNIKIMLIPNTPLETIQSGVASEVSIYSGTKVNFDGAFEDENGNTYTGTVSVSMFHLTPSDENIDKLMPGMLYAQTATNEEAVLETFGMLNVELRGSAGQKLNIAEGHTAEITMRIDDTQLATAPNSIPLWHFDEARGYWKEDGVATKVGNKYVGEVSHFSWWNCDIPNSTIVLAFNFVDSLGNPLSNLNVVILDSNGYHATGASNENGQLSGLFPAGQELIVQINSPFFNCSEGAAISFNIGPYDSDAMVPDIVLPMSSNMQSTKIAGQLLKCDGNKVDNGYVQFVSDNQTEFIPVENGSFSLDVIYCPTDTKFKLQGIDFDNNQLTDDIVHNYRQIVTNVGSLYCCNSNQEFATYKVDDGEVQIYNSIFSYTVNYNPPGLDYFYISANNGAYTISAKHGVGIYTNPNGSFNLSSSTASFGGSANISNLSPSNLIIEINKIGPVGDFMDLVYYGTFTTSTGLHTITGNAHVRRDN